MFDRKNSEVCCVDNISSQGNLTNHLTNGNASSSSSSSSSSSPSSSITPMTATTTLTISTTPSSTNDISDDTTMNETGDQTTILLATPKPNRQQQLQQQQKKLGTSKLENSNIINNNKNDNDKTSTNEVDHHQHHHESMVNNLEKKEIDGDSSRISNDDQEPGISSNHQESVICNQQAKTFIDDHVSGYYSSLNKRFKQNMSNSISSNKMDNDSSAIILNNGDDDAPSTKVLSEKGSGTNGTWYATLSTPTNDNGDDEMLFLDNNNKSTATTTTKSASVNNHHHHHHRHHRNHVEVHFHHRNSSSSTQTNVAAGGTTGLGSSSASKRKNGIIVHHVVHHHHPYNKLHYHHHHRHHHQRHPNTTTFEYSTKSPHQSSTLSTTSKSSDTPIKGGGVPIVNSSIAHNDKDKIRIQQQLDRKNIMAESMVLSQTPTTTAVPTFNKFPQQQSSISSTSNTSSCSPVNSITHSTSATIASNNNQSPPAVDDMIDDVDVSSKRSSSPSTTTSHQFRHRHRHLHFKSPKYSSSSSSSSSVLNLNHQHRPNSKTFSGLFPDTTISPLKTTSSSSSSSSSLSSDNTFFLSKDNNNVEEELNDDENGDEEDLKTDIKGETDMMEIGDDDTNYEENKTNSLFKVDRDAANEDHRKTANISAPENEKNIRQSNKIMKLQNHSIGTLKQQDVVDPKECSDHQNCSSPISTNDTNDDNSIVDLGEDLSPNDNKTLTIKNVDVRAQRRRRPTPTSNHGLTHRVNTNHISTDDNVDNQDHDEAEEDVEGDDDCTSKHETYNNKMLDVSHKNDDANNANQFKIDVGQNFSSDNNQEMKPRRQSLIDESCNNVLSTTDSIKSVEDNHQTFNANDDVDEDDELMNNFDPTEVLKRMKMELKEEFDDYSHQSQQHQSELDCGLMVDNNNDVCDMNQNHNRSNDVNGAKSINRNSQYPKNKNIIDQQHQQFNHFDNEHFRKMFQHFSMIQQQTMADLDSVTRPTSPPQQASTAINSSQLAALTVAAAAAAAASSQDNAFLMLNDEETKKRILQTLILKQLNGGVAFMCNNIDNNDHVSNGEPLPESDHILLKQQSSGNGKTPIQLDPTTLFQSFIRSSMKSLSSVITPSQSSISSATTAQQATPQQQSIDSTETIANQRPYDHPEHRFCSSCNIQFMSTKTYKVHKELYCSSRHNLPHLSHHHQHQTGSLSSSSSASSTLSTITTTSSSTITTNNITKNNINGSTPIASNNQSNQSANMAYGSNSSSKSSSLANSQTSSGIGSSPPPSSFSSSSPNSSSNSTATRGKQRVSSQNDMSTMPLDSIMDQDNEQAESSDHHHLSSVNVTNNNEMILTDDCQKYTDFRALFPGLIPNNTNASINASTTSKQASPINGMMASLSNLKDPISAINLMSPIYIAISTDPLVLIPFTYNRINNSFDPLPSFAANLSPVMLDNLKLLAPTPQSSLVFPTGLAPFNDVGSKQPFMTTFEELKKIDLINDHSTLLTTKTSDLQKHLDEKSTNTCEKLISKRSHSESNNPDQPLDLSNSTMSPKSKRTKLESDPEINNNLCGNESSSLIGIKKETSFDTDNCDVESLVSSNKQRQESYSATTSAAAAFQEHMNNLLQKFAMMQQASIGSGTKPLDTSVPRHVNLISPTISSSPPRPPPLSLFDAGQADGTSVTAAAVGNQMAAAAALARENPAFAQYVAMAMAALTTGSRVPPGHPPPPSVTASPNPVPITSPLPHVDVVVKQGNSRCAECNIVFYKHENYLVHKKLYCASRRNLDPLARSMSPSSNDAGNRQQQQQSSGNNSIIPNRPTSASSCSSSLSYTTSSNKFTSSVIVPPESTPSCLKSGGNSNPDETLSLSTSPSLMSSREAASVSPAAALMSPNNKQSAVCQYFCAACGIKYTSFDNLNAHQTYYCLKRNLNQSSNLPQPSSSTGAAAPVSPAAAASPLAASPVPSAAAATAVTPQSILTPQLLAAAATLGSQPGAAEALLDFTSPTSLSQQWSALVTAAAVVGAKSGATIPNGLLVGDYNCHKCKASYVSPETLATHVCSADQLRLVAEQQQQQSSGKPEKPPNTTPSTSSLQTYKCTICGYKGHTMRGMRTHVRVHAEELASTGAFEEDFIVQNTDLPEPSTGRRSSHGNSLTNPARQRRRSNNLEAQLFSCHSNASISSSDTLDSVIRSTVSNYLESAARRGKEQQLIDEQRKTNSSSSLINANIENSNHSNQSVQNHNCQFCPYTSNYKGNVIRHIKLVHKDMNGALLSVNLQQQQQLIKEAVDGLMSNVDLMDQLSATDQSNDGTKFSTTAATATLLNSKTMVNGATCSGGESRSSTPTPTKSSSQQPQASSADNNNETTSPTSTHNDESDSKYCSACNISFTYRGSYLAHKRYYCSSHTNET